MARHGRACNCNDGAAWPAPCKSSRRVAWPGTAALTPLLHVQELEAALDWLRFSGVPYLSYSLLGPVDRRYGGQGVVQFATGGIGGHQQFAIKARVFLLRWKALASRYACMRSSRLERSCSCRSARTSNRWSGATRSRAC